MTTCHEARELLLEADLDELTGERPSPLAQHLVTCAACRARAERIVAGQRALGEALNALRPRPVRGAVKHTRIDPPAATATSPAPIRDAVPGALTRPWASGTQPGRPRRPWRLAVPLALAAGLAVLLLQSRKPTPVGTAIQLAASTAAQDELDVRVPAGQRVAVFHTDNPDIVVIWSF